MTIGPVSASPPAFVVIVPFAVESDGTILPMAATLFCNLAIACGSWAGGWLVVGVCARVIIGAKVKISTRCFMAPSKRTVTLPARRVDTPLLNCLKLVQAKDFGTNQESFIRCDSKISRKQQKSGPQTARC